MTVQFKLTAWSIAKLLLLVVSVLLVLNVALVLSKSAFGFGFHTVKIFYFNEEGNFPSAFSTLLLLAIALLAFKISKLAAEHAAGKKYYWAFLSIVFLFLAIDEAISIHETLTDDTQLLLGAERAKGLLYFSWIIPYGIGLVFATLLFFRFYLKLPFHTKLYFALAASLYIAGALGLEMLGGKYIFDQGNSAKESLTYMLLITLEETLEMLGCIVFIYALTAFYLSKIHHVSFHVSLDAETNHFERKDASILKPEVRKKPQETL